MIPEDWDWPGAVADLSAPLPIPAPVAAGPTAPPVVADLTPTPAPVAAPQAAAAHNKPAIAPQVTPADPSAANIESSDDLLSAFLDGAGIGHLRLDTQQAKAQMHSLGRSYRLMVEGLIDVLRARASLKGEFRMQQTLIQPLENNPLKFAPNADEALLLLLRHGNQAFMAPDQAVSDSFDDLKAHQLAVMAGVQAAIGQLLKRFEPSALQARLESPGGLAGLLSGPRQARYWQQFTELYSQIAGEAEDDFQDLFGREFSRAYEAHSARQRQG